MIGAGHIGAISAARYSGGAVPAGAHRYWRVLFTGIESSRTRLVLAEVQFWDRLYARRVPGSHSASGDSGSGFEAVNAFDDATSFNTTASGDWVSNLVSSGDIWAAIDAGVGNEFQLAAVVLWRSVYTSSSFGGPTDFDVQYSDDGSTWTTAWSESSVSLPAASLTTGTAPGVFVNPSYPGDPEVALDAISPLHWLKLDDGIFSDAGSTPAVNNDGIHQATNFGTDGTPFNQASSGNRPTYKTGGLNGKPYLLCVPASAQKFDDIAISQPSGTTTVNPYGLIVVTDSITGLADFPAILGSNAADSGGKAAFYFRSTANQQIHAYKSGFRFGNVANPMVLAITIPDYTRRIVMQNGVYSRTQVAGSANTDAITAANFLWNEGTTPDGYFNGRLYEFMYFNQEVGQPLMYRISRYLNAKYGSIF